MQVEQYGLELELFPSYHISHLTLHTFASPPHCPSLHHRRYLNIAQTLLNGLGSSAKYSGALRALRECYERLNKVDKMQICSERIAEVSSVVVLCSVVLC